MAKKIDLSANTYTSPSSSVYNQGSVNLGASTYQPSTSSVYNDTYSSGYSSGSGFGFSTYSSSNFSYGYGNNLVDESMLHGKDKLRQKEEYKEALAHLQDVGTCAFTRGGVAGGLVGAAFGNGLGGVALGTIAAIPGCVQELNSQRPRLRFGDGNEY